MNIIWRRDFDHIYIYLCVNTKITKKKWVKTRLTIYLEILIVIFWIQDKSNHKIIPRNSTVDKIQDNISTAFRHNFKGFATTLLSIFTLGVFFLTLPDKNFGINPWKACYGTKSHVICYPCFGYLHLVRNLHEKSLFC